MMVFKNRRDSMTAKSRFKIKGLVFVAKRTPMAEQAKMPVRRGIMAPKWMKPICKGLALKMGLAMR